MPSRTLGPRAKGLAGAGSIVQLTRLARVVYRHSTVELLGIRLKELAALAYLRDHAHTSQQSLSEAMGADANACVLLLNELEASGFVERHRDQDDRRRHLVVLTSAGRSALERAEKAQGSIEDEVLSALSLDERVVLNDLLTRALEGHATSAE